MTTLTTVLAAPEGRYVATAQEGDVSWHVYVAWESSKLIRKRTRWWHAAASWDASLAEAMQRAWHGRRLHVDLLDYDTPDEEPMSLSMDESCMLTIHTEQGEHALTLLPCCAQEAAQASVPLLAEAAMEQALQAAQASLDAERVKYREVRLRTNAAPGRRSRCASVVFFALAHTSWTPSVRTRH